MGLLSRVLFLGGAVAILAAIGIAMWWRSVEYASWVAGIVGGVAIAIGLVMRAFSPASEPNEELVGVVGGDDIDQEGARAKGSVIGKSGAADPAPRPGPRSLPGSVAGDRIRQRNARAKGDIIGKQTPDDSADDSR